MSDNNTINTSMGEGGVPVDGKGFFRTQNFKTLLSANNYLPNKKHEYNTNNNYYSSLYFNLIIHNSAVLYQKSAQNIFLMDFPCNLRYFALLSF